MDQLLVHINRIEQLLESYSPQKEVLTFKEGCRYCGFTPSHMYKLTSSNMLPFYKPNGKMIFFRRSELDAWILRDRYDTISDHIDRDMRKKKPPDVVAFNKTISRPSLLIPNLLKTK